MAFNSVKLIPGVNTEQTLSLNEAGISHSNLVRFKQGLVQKLGGFNSYSKTPISTQPIRDICTFVSLRNLTFVAAAAQNRVAIISTSGVLTDISPQVADSNTFPSFSVSSGSNLITVVDPASSMGQFGAIRFDTPIAVDSFLLNGAFPINGILDSNTYTITAPSAATTTVSSGGTLPTFATTAGSAIADVYLPNHQYTAGTYYQFQAPTTVAGQMIQGPFFVSTVIDSTHVQITLNVQASATIAASLAVPMNGGLAAIHHYMVIGPTPTAAPYGTGLYGAGAYGIGTIPSQGTGVAITSSDWSVDADWTALVANPRGEAIYTWASEQALSTMTPIIAGGAPLRSNGVFTTQPQQMLMAWGCQSLTTGIQDPLLIRWSDTANFNVWTPATNNAAGSFRIPTGGQIRGGLQAPQYVVFWTDIDVWIAQFVGQPLTWSFNHFGTGCGLIGPHAAGVFGGQVYWMGQSNFFTLGATGATPMPCPVWDFIFQQLDLANANKSVCAPNSAFSEVAWYFPVVGGNGENQAYVKVHIEGSEYEWDYGFLPRSAWYDLSAAGMPLGADPMGNVVQHETSFDAAGAPLNASFETGYFALSEGRQFGFVDFVIPDFIWSRFGGSVPGLIKITFFAVDFPGDTERVYGPYTVTQGSEYIGTRIRGRLMRMRFESQDLGSFWRIGRVRYRFSVDGAR